MSFDKNSDTDGHRLSDLIGEAERSIRDRYKENEAGPGMVRVVSLRSDEKTAKIIKTAGRGSCTAIGLLAESKEGDLIAVVAHFGQRAAAVLDGVKELRENMPPKDSLNKRAIILFDKYAEGSARNLPKAVVTLWAEGSVIILETEVHGNELPELILKLEPKNIGGKSTWTIPGFGKQEL